MLLSFPVPDEVASLPIMPHVFERLALSSMWCLFLCHDDFLQGHNGKVL